MSRCDEGTRSDESARGRAGQKGDQQLRNLRTAPATPVSGSTRGRHTTVRRNRRRIVQKEWKRLPKCEASRMLLPQQRGMVRLAARPAPQLRQPASKTRKLMGARRTRRIRRRAADQRSTRTSVRNQNRASPTVTFNPKPPDLREANSGGSTIRRFRSYLRNGHDQGWYHSH